MRPPIRARIQTELTRLHGQRKRYLLAIAVAQEPRLLRRHLRNVLRLDDEIAARREALDALPVESQSIALGDADVIMLDETSKTTIWAGQ